MARKTVKKKENDYSEFFAALAAMEEEKGIPKQFIAEKIAESGFPAIVGPSMAARSKKEVSESDFKTAGILKQAGVPVALTTDHPVCRLQYLPLCAALAVKEGMSKWDALCAITIEAARICKVDHRVGSLAVGKDADIVVADGIFYEISTKLEYVFINGVSQRTHVQFHQTLDDVVLD